MGKDLLQGEFVLSADEKITVIGKLDKIANEHPYCSACCSAVDVSFLRKHHNTPLYKAMCLPCFLANFTDETLADITRMVEMAQYQKWYK